MNVDAHRNQLISSDDIDFPECIIGCIIRVWHLRHNIVVIEYRAIGYIVKYEFRLRIELILIGIIV